MNFNVGVENPGVLVWDGSKSYPRDLSGFIAFGFTFEATDDIVADTVFIVEYADPSDANPCLPGTFKPVEEIAICQPPVAPGAPAMVTIPAGTLAGTICAGTLPCIPGKFIQLTAERGETGKVLATITYHGPRSA